jgi:hypothetical protein
MEHTDDSTAPTAEADEGEPLALTKTDRRALIGLLKNTLDLTLSVGNAARSAEGDPGLARTTETGPAQPAAIVSGWDTDPAREAQVRMLSAIRNMMIGGIAVVALAGQTPIFIYGRGQDSCEQFMQAAGNEHKARPPNAEVNVIYTPYYAAYQDYAQGFLSGANWVWGLQGNDKNARIGPNGPKDYFTDEMTWLENYCRAHPLDGYGGALIHLRNALAAKEQQ